MNVLIIGAGAVGQHYGYCLREGGAKVSFYVRPKYVEESKKGFALYPLNARSGRETPSYLKGCEILSTLEEVAASSWDQVWICIPSTGLRGGWLEEMMKVFTDETILVSLTPSIVDRDFLLEHWPARRLVIGLITSISYYAPLPGESVPEPGVAFYFPPLTKAAFAGDEEKVAEIVAVLKKGGMPARREENLVAKTSYANIALMCFIAGLEGADWSFDEVRKRPHIQRIHKAIGEGVKLVSKSQGTPIPLPMRLLTPGIEKMVVSLAPALVPLDFEAFLKSHFTKVGGQTRLFFQNYLDTAKEIGVEVPHLRELAESL